METPGDPSPSPDPTEYGSARTMAIVGFVLAGLGLLFLPIILGPAAAILGYLSMRRGDPLGRWALVAGIASLLIGILVAAAIVSSES